MTEIIHKELSYRVVGSVFDVHNGLRPGVREECYQKAMEQRLYENGLPFAAKPKTRREFVYRDQIVDVFEPDFVVADKLILELKHQVEGFVPENESQVLNYLKFWNLELGLLANFAIDKAITHRVPRLAFEATLDEDYSHIADLIREDHKPVLRAIRDSLFEIYRVIGLGYTATTYQKLVLVELRHRALDVQTDLVVEPVFHERKLPHTPISPMIVSNQVCLEVEAIHDDVSARLMRTMQTHLELTEKPIGIVATFGRRKLSIRGIKPR